jgi:nitrite reductase/ring-hydroxylating ferredoxin subunit
MQVFVPGLAGLLGLLSLGSIGAVFKFLLPRAKKDEFGGVFNLGSISQLPAVGDAPLNHAKGRFWLVRGDEGLVAFYKACTHLDCLFDWNPQEGKFICPCHGSKFSSGGRVLGGPAPRDLDRFTVHLISPKGKLIAEAGSDEQMFLPLKASKQAVQDGKANNASQVVYRLGSGADAVSIPADAQVLVDAGRKFEGRKARFVS